MFIPAKSNRFHHIIIINQIAWMQSRGQLTTSYYVLDECIVTVESYFIYFIVIIIKYYMSYEGALSQLAQTHWHISIWAQFLCICTYHMVASIYSKYIYIYPYRQVVFFLSGSLPKNIWKNWFPQDKSLAINKSQNRLNIKSQYFTKKKNIF